MGNKFESIDVEMSMNPHKLSENEERIKCTAIVLLQMVPKNLTTTIQCYQQLHTESQVKKKNI